MGVGMGACERGGRACVHAPLARVHGRLSRAQQGQPKGDSLVLGLSATTLLSSLTASSTTRRLGERLRSRMAVLKSRFLLRIEGEGEEEGVGEQEDERDSLSLVANARASRHKRRDSLGGCALAGPGLGGAVLLLDGRVGLGRRISHRGAREDGEEGSLSLSPCGMLFERRAGWVWVGWGSGCLGALGGMCVRVCVCVCV